MGKSSLEVEFSLWDIEYNNGNTGAYENDDYWYLREVCKNINYRSGPVTVIKFDYLEQK